MYTYGRPFLHCKWVFSSLCLQHLLTIINCHNNLISIQFFCIFGIQLNFLYRWLISCGWKSAKNTTAGCHLAPLWFFLWKFKATIKLNFRTIVIGCSVSKQNNANLVVILTSCSQDKKLYFKNWEKLCSAN